MERRSHFRILVAALRWKNLLMVALTQAACWRYLRWQCWIAPFKVLDNTTNLALLVFSTVCITAAGYLINDAFDIAIDARNKPQKALPNTPEARRKVLWLYGILNALGLLAAVLPALAAGKFSLLAIQGLTIVLLWAYSAWWKRLPVIGNVVVALLTALSIALLYLYEPILWDPGASAFAEHDLRHAVTGLLWLAGFAFLLTWMREMVKDIEDLEGDRAEGCRTLPIVWGVQNTIWVVASLSALSTALLATTAVLEFLAWGKQALFTVALFTLLLILPLAAWTITLFFQKTPAGFHRHSNLLKLLMLGGLVCLWAV